MAMKNHSTQNRRTTDLKDISRIFSGTLLQLGGPLHFQPCPSPTDSLLRHSPACPLEVRDPILPEKKVEITHTVHLTHQAHQGRRLPRLERLWGNVCPARARRATFLLTIPTSAPDLPSHVEAPQVDHVAMHTFPTKHIA